MASGLTNRGAYLFATGLDWTTDDIRCLATTSGFTPLKTHNTVSEVTNELTNSGYARAALGSKTATEDDSNGRVKCDAADVVYSALAAGGTPYWLIYYLEAGSDAARQIIGWVDVSSGALAPNGAAYTLQFDSIGLFVGTT